MRKLILILPFLLLPGTVDADEYFAFIESPNQVYGCWKRINFPETAMQQMNKIEPFPLKHQWYCFLEDGEFLALHSNKDANYSAAQVIAQVRILPVVEEYSIPRPGVILTVHKAAQQHMYWMSSLITKDWALAGVELREGDVLMTLRNRETGKDDYSRFLRRIR